MKNLISKLRAIEICSHWYEGQTDSLYQFLSSGIFVPEKSLLYLRSVQSCLEPEYYLHPQTLSKKDQKELNSLKRFFEFKCSEVGISIKWEKHPTYGYLVPFVKENPNNIQVKKLSLIA